MSWTVKRSKSIYISLLRKIWWLMVSKALLEPRRKMQSTEFPLSIADKTISASETMASLLLCFFLNPYWRSVLILNLELIWGLLWLRNPYMIDLSIGMNENLKFSFEKRNFIWQCFPKNCAKKCMTFSNTWTHVQPAVINLCWIHCLHKEPLLPCHQLYIGKWEWFMTRYVT